MNNLNKIALILSFIFPGFGQIWNREYIKGINFIFLQIIFIILVFYPDSNLYPIGMVAIPVLWIWGMVDASRIYHIYSSEHRRTQRRRNLRLTLGIIAFLILSEAIFVPTILTIRRNYKTSSEEGQASPSAVHEVTAERSEHPWVVTVSVSENPDEISKLYHELRKKYQVQIIPVSSNPTHNAFAVAITGFATIPDAQIIANELCKDIPNCFVASYENPAISVISDE